MIFGAISVIIMAVIAVILTVILTREYESEVKYWMNESDEARARNVRLADRIFVLNDEANEYENIIEKRNITIRDHLLNIRELSNITDICPHCGATELICGHNGRGCTHENDEIEEQEEMVL